MRCWLVALAAAGLVVAPSASAKTLKKIVVVGANGTSTEITGLDFGDWANSPARVAPKGPFVLVYPLMEGDIVAQPGRYYPAFHALCFSWDRRFAGRCYSAPSSFEAGAADLPALQRALPYVKRITVAGKKRSDWSNGAVAIELAFNRPGLARALRFRPQHCRSVEVKWSAPSRPSRFWACAGGIWSAGKLYPAGRLLF